VGAVSADSRQQTLAGGYADSDLDPELAKWYDPDADVASGEKLLPAVLLRCDPETPVELLAEIARQEGAL
jgi:hypothetical protein